MTDSKLIANCLEDIGCDSIDDWFEWGIHDAGGPLDAVMVGACRDCGAVTDSCEPDMREGWCADCGSDGVESLASIVGIC
jgi:hypothetical protein